MSAELYDHELEELVVSQCISSEKFFKLITNTNGLRADHFHQPHCSKLFDIIGQLPFNAERTTASIALEFTRVTGSAIHESNELIARVASLSKGIDTSSLSGSSADRLKLLWKWRTRSDAAQKILDATETLDEEAMSQAMRLVDDSASTQSSTSLTANEWGGLMFEWLNSGEEDTIATPFVELNHALSGGLRRGQLTVIGGYTGHGKSILIDQILDHAVESDGIRGHLYLSEMTFIERGQRLISRRLGIPLRAVREKRFSPEEYVEALALFKKMSYGVSLISGWTIEELSMDIKRCEWDVCAVDLIHGFDYKDTYGLENIMRHLMFASKGNGKNRGTAVLATSHLNDIQVNGDGVKANPKPQIRNLKGSSAIKQYSDNILFLWRQADEYGQLLREGKLWTAKTRQAEPMYPLDVRLDAKSMRFVRG